MKKLLSSFHNLLNEHKQSVDVRLTKITLSKAEVSIAKFTLLALLILSIVNTSLVAGNCRISSPVDNHSQINTRESTRSFVDPSPGYYETSEYLIGSVAVGIIMPESDGSLDPSTEHWEPEREEDVPIRIDDGLDVLVSYNPFSFIFDVHYRVPTKYEPVTRDHTDDTLWISDVMSNLGYTEGDHLQRVNDYVNDLRNSTGTDWAFAIFVVDSVNDDNGCFADWYPAGNCYWYAYAKIGGPYFVMTYDVGRDYQLPRTPGVAQMDRVTAHETAHIFWATDEYNGQTEYSGYLNVADIEGSGDLMDNSNWGLSDGTWGQLGWTDSDMDGLEDIIETYPNTALDEYSPDPTTDPTPTYTGEATVVPYPNSNPQPWNSHRDVTINTITNVQFRVDSGSWIDATPTDGAFDEALEDFSFTTSTLEEGPHVIETRAINSVGNVETSYASDTLTIASAGNPVHNIDTNLNYSSIQAAIDASETLNGHTIYVDSGIYNEQVDIHKSLTMIGEDMETTVVDGQNIGSTISISANGVTLSNFTITNSGSTYPESGIFLDWTENSAITKNNVSFNNGHGIFSMWGNNNSINNNLILNNTEPGIRVDGINSQAILYNNTIKYNLHDGIFLYAASDVLVENNTIINNSRCGISPQGGSRNNTISNNLIKNNGWNGIFFYASNSSLVEQNILENNGFGGPSEWVLSGIDLHEQSNNITIINNCIKENKYGVQLVDSNDTQIFYNNFIDNINQVWMEDAYNITWDHGYPSGGNYWSDYLGNDLYCGIYQNETGSDGFGDTPMIINGNNQDNYPLLDIRTHSYESISNVSRGEDLFQIIYTHNTTITDSQETPGSIKITTAGETGTSSYVRIIQPVGLNSSNIKVFLNNTKLTFPSTDPPRSISTNSTHYFIYFTFTFNSSYELIVGFPIIGDVDYNGIVDIFDVVKVAVAYGSISSDPNWDIHCDVAEEYGVIDIFDIVFVATRYGDEWS